MELIICCLVFGVVFGALGAWIANEKHRDQGEGFILGLLFGPLGVIIEAIILPTPQQPQPVAALSVPILTPEAEERLERQWQEQLEQRRDEKRGITE